MADNIEFDSFKRSNPDLIGGFEKFAAKKDAEKATTTANNSGGDTGNGAGNGGGGDDVETITTISEGINRKDGGDGLADNEFSMQKRAQEEIDQEKADQAKKREEDAAAASKDDKEKGDVGNAGEGEGEGDGSDNDKPTSFLKGIAEKIGYADGYEFPEDPNEEDMDAVVDYMKFSLKKNEEDAVRRYLESRPIQAQFHEHLEAGKSPETFLRKLHTDEVETVEITEDNVGLQENIIRADLRANGLKDETIDKLIRVSKDDGSLLEAARASQENIRTKRQQSIAAQEEAEAQRAQEQRERSIAIVNNVREIIGSGNIGNFTLPESEKADFEKFLFVPDENGVTARMKAIKETPIHNELLIDYLRFKNFKVKGINASAGSSTTKRTLADLNKDKRGEGHRTIKNNDSRQQQTSKEKSSLAELRKKVDLSNRSFGAGY